MTTWLVYQAQKNRNMRDIKKVLSIVVITLSVILLLVGCKNQKTSLSDGTYQVEVSMTGGTGKAYIESPAQLVVENGIATITFVWSSKNYDYLIVNDVKYLNENEGGPSTFAIPLGDVSTIWEPFTIIGDTVAMSTPHEIEYTITLTLCGDSTQSQSALKNQNNESLSSNEYDNWEYEDISYSTGFTIQKKDDYRYITIESGETSIQKILVVPEGAKPPKEDGIVILQRSLDKTYLVSTSAMDLVREIGALDNIRLSGTKENDWALKEATEAMREGRILYAGKYSAPDYELILSEGCNLAIENSMIYHNPETKEKLEELGIPVVVEMSSYENHPLGRLEWIKFYGALFDAEEEASAYFENQVSRINKVCTTENKNIKVAFFSVNSSGLITVRKSGDYISQMIELAGGEYVPEQTSSEENALSTMNMQVEEFYAGAKDADILIYNSTIMGELGSVSDLTAKSTLFEDFAAVKTGKIYCTGKNFFQETTGMAEFMEDLKNIYDGNNEELNYLVKVN